MNFLHGLLMNSFIESHGLPDQAVLSGACQIYIFMPSIGGIP